MCSFDLVDGCFRCRIALQGMVFFDMVDGGRFFDGLLDGLIFRHRRGMFLGLARVHRRTFSLP